MQHSSLAEHCSMHGYGLHCLLPRLICHISLPMLEPVRGTWKQQSLCNALMHSSKVVAYKMRAKSSYEHVATRLACKTVEPLSGVGFCPQPQSFVPEHVHLSPCW